MAKEKNKELEEEQEKRREFIEEYQKLCSEYGYQINVTPGWANDGDVGYKLQLNLGLTPVEDEEDSKEDE